MVLRAANMPGARLPSGELDPADPKNSYAILHAKRMSKEKEQDDRIAKAYREGKLKKPTNVPGLLSHNNALIMASAAGGGWTHAERWRPTEEDERERLKREGHGEAMVVGQEGGEQSIGDRDLNGDVGISPEVTGQGERAEKKDIGRRISRVLFGG